MRSAAVVASLILASSCNRSDPAAPSGPRSAAAQCSASSCLTGACTASDSTCGLAVSLSPAVPRTRDAITASANQPLDGLKVAWTWSNAATGLVRSGAVLPAFATTRGEVWTATLKATAKNGNSATASAQVTIANTPPSLTGARLTPAAPDRSATLHCAPLGWHDDDGDSPLLDTAWFVQSGAARTPLPGAAQDRSAADLLPGQQVFCELTPRDAFDAGAPVDSPPVAIIDRAPRLDGATLSSSDARPTRLSSLTCAPLNASDPDGDPLTLGYSWLVNGLPLAGGSTLSGAFVRGDQVACVVTASDGWLSQSRTSRTLTILDAAPVVTAVSVSGGACGGVFTCNVDAQDADGDPLTLHYKWLADGKVITGQLSQTLPARKVAAGQLVSCAARADDGLIFAPQVVSQAVAASDGAPVIASVAIPASAHPGTPLTCAVSASDDCSTPVISYAWAVNGASVAGAAQAFDTSALRPGDSVVCVATASDGAHATSQQSNAAAIVNQAPAIGAVAISSSDATPTRSSTLTCAASGVSDADGDAVSVTYAWAVDGSAAGSGSTLAGAFARGQSVTCTATAADAWAQRAATSAALAIGDAAPVVSAVSVSGGHACAPWTCSATAQDPDGDSVSLRYRWFSAGSVIAGQSGAALPAQHFAAGQFISCAASATDGTLTGAEVQSQALAALDSAPELGTVSLPATAHRGQSLTCAATATDDCGAPSISYAWQVNGAAAAGSGASFDTSALKAGDTVTCTATASDGAQSSAPASASTAIVNQPPHLDGAALTASGAQPTRLSTLACAALGASDPDGDPLTATYAWRVDGALLAASGSTLAGAFVRGQSVTCSVTVSDGAATASATSAALAIVDAPPAVTSVTVSGGAACAAWTCHAEAQDPDGDAALTLHYRWLVDGHEVAGQTSGTLPPQALAAGALVACAARADDGLATGDEVQSQAATASDSAPTLQAVSLPVETHHGETLTCAATASDDCDASPTVSVAWQVNGLAAGTGPTFTATSRGDIITCTAVASDGVQQSEPASASTVVVNRPPSLAAALLTSDANPTRLSTFTCAAAGASDPDGDPLAVSFSWLIDGAKVADAAGSTLSGAFVKGQTVRCAVAVSDGAASASAVSAGLAVGDLAPLVTSVAVSGGEACAAWTCAASAQDPDGDALSLHYRWFIDGNVVPGQTTQSLPAQGLAAGQRVSCAARADDGALQSPEVVSQAVAAVDQPPSLDSVTLPASVHSWNRTFTCAVKASDDCAGSLAITYAWQIDGQTVPGAVSSTFSNTAGLGVFDTLSCAATVSDGFQATTVQSNPTVFANHAPTLAGIAITTPDPRPTLDSALYCTLQGLSDADGDPLTVQYLWTADGQWAGNQRATSGYDKGQQLVCSVAISDGFEEIDAVSAPVTIQDTPPTVDSASVVSSLACGAWSCLAAGLDDVDGDSTSLHYRWFVDGAEVPGAAGRDLDQASVPPGAQLACAASADDGTLTGPETRSPAIAAVLPPLAINGVSLPATVHPTDPAKPLTCDAQLSTACRSGLTLTYAWLLDGVVIAGQSGPTFFPGPADYGAGDPISCRVTVSDGVHTLGPVTSNKSVITNQPPGVASVTIVSSDPVPTVASRLTCNPQGITDPDGDVTSTSFLWSVNGTTTQTSGQTFNGGARRGQRVQCDALVSDPFQLTDWPSNSVVLADSPPTVQSVSLLGGDKCNHWTCTPSGVKDADNDPVTLHYRWLINGATVPNQSGATLPSGVATSGQSVACAVRGDDGQLSGGSLVFGPEVKSNTIVDDPGAAPITVSASVAPGVHPGDTLTCDIHVNDSCSTSWQTLLIYWEVNRQNSNRSQGSTTFSTAGLHSGDKVRCGVAVADSGYGWSAFSNEALVGDLAPVISSVTLAASDARPTIDSSFTCTAGPASDPDGDAFSVGYAWFVNGAQVANNDTTSLNGGYRKGDVVSCAAFATDSLGVTSVALQSQPITILDALPAVGGVSIVGNHLSCGSWLCDWAYGGDPDGDPTTFHYQWYADGSPISGATGKFLPGGDAQKGQNLTCSITLDDGLVENGVAVLGPASFSPAVKVVDDPPNLSVHIPDGGYHPGSPAQCAWTVSDDCTANLGISIAWTVNGNTVVGQTGASLPTSGLTPGDQVLCIVTATDSLGQKTVKPSDRAVPILDRAPTASAVIATDARPTRSSTLTCQATVSDPDSDPLTTSYAWALDGVPVPGAAGKTLSGAFTHGQTATCTVTTTDRWLTATATSPGVLIHSILPTVQSVAVSGAGVCTPFTCTASGVADGDGDAVTVHYQWLINGVDQGLDQAQLPAQPQRRGAAIACSAWGDDGTVEGGAHLLGAAVTSASVTPGQQPPVLTGAAISPAGEAHAGDLLSCSAGYTDLCSSSDKLTLEWDVNGVARQTNLYPLSNQTSRTDTFSTAGLHVGDVISCKATVDDLGVTAAAPSNAVTIVTDTWTLTANVAGGQAGYSVAVTDDLNGDGLREIAVGSPNATAYNGAPRAGLVYLVNGRQNTVTSRLSDVAINVGGNLIAGDHGGFDVGAMACTVFQGQSCPLLHDVGSDIIAEMSGPNGAGFGFGLAYAGDLDGDGIGDLVATAPYDQVSNLWTGRTYVLSGRRLLQHPIDAAVAGEAGFVFDGECGRRRKLDSASLRDTDVNGDLAGWRVVPIGDANGDGLGDFAVSAPNNGDMDEGTVYVVFGRSDGKGVVASDIFQRGCNLERKTAPGPLSGIAGYAAYAPTEPQGNSAPQRWGQRIGSAGDFNGDGYDDLLIAGNAGTTTNGNAGWVQLGGPHPGPRAIGATDPATQWQIDLGNSSFTYNNVTGHFTCTSGIDGAFWASGGGGDVNGDGLDDLAFQEFDCTHAGFLNVLYGTRTPPAGAIFHMESTADGSGKGFEVTGSGLQFDSGSGVLQIVPDLNGDGFDDIVLGIPTQNGSAGLVAVVFGSAQPPVGLTLDKLRQGIGGFTIEPQVPGAQFGWSVAAGDVDGDGLTDLVIGAPHAAGSGGESNAGSVQVVFGRDFTGGTLAFKGTSADDHFTGTAAAESIIGGRGNDVLIGGGGADVIYGGAGDDVIEVDDSSFRRVNGGPGNDTLVLGPAVGDLALTGQNRRRIQEIENLKLQGQTLTLSKLGLVAVSATAHKLAVFGSGRVILQAGDHWKKTGTATGADGSVYNVLADGAATLWLSQGLATNIPPTVFDGPMSVPENSAAGATVATLGATDPDGNDANLTWRLVSDPSGAFAVDAHTGGLRVASAVPLDFEAKQWPWDVVVDVTDQSGLTTRATFSVSLTDVEEPPVFAAGSYRWSVNESDVGVLGNVQAPDPDAGDAVTYAIVADPSGLFQIDPVKGDVSLKDGQGFHYALAPGYTLTLSATDTRGAQAVATVQLDVIPQDPLVRTAHVNFQIRDWSVYQDSKSSAFPGLKPIGLDQTNACGSQPSPDLASFVEPWSALFVDGPVSVQLPVQLHAQYLGTVCTTTDFNYDSGTFNATIPYDVSFSYPEQISPGQTFTLTSSATASTAGAALWGNSPGFEFDAGIELKNFGIYMAICSEYPSESCRTIVNKAGVNAKTQGKWGLPVAQWQAALGSDPDKVQLTMASPVTSSTKGLSIPWDDTWTWVASLFGLPSNTGTIPITVNNYKIEFDYVLFTASMGFHEDSDWTFGLDANGVAATLVLEDGTSYTFPLGKPVDITVPAGADVNGDGRVDVSIQLALDSTFHDTWHHHDTLGYMYSGGFGRLRAFDALGTVVAKRSVGPAYQNGCGLEAKSSTEPNDPVNCLSGSGTSQFDFKPSGFSRPIINGGFDVKAH